MNPDERTSGANTVVAGIGNPRPRSPLFPCKRMKTAAQTVTPSALYFLKENDPGIDGEPTIAGFTRLPAAALFPRTRRVCGRIGIFLL